MFRKLTLIVSLFAVIVTSALAGETSFAQLTRDNFNMLSDTLDDLDDLAERVYRLRDKLRTEQERVRDLLIENDIDVPQRPSKFDKKVLPVHDFAGEPSYVLYVTAKWCAPCQQVKPYMEELRREGMKLEEWGPNKSGDVFVVDFDELQPNRNRAKFRIKADVEMLPCFIKVGGSPPGEISRKTGYLTKQQFIDFYFERKKS